MHVRVLATGVAAVLLNPAAYRALGATARLITGSGTEMDVMARLQGRPCKQRTR